MQPAARLMPIIAVLAGVGMLSLMDAYMKSAALAVGAYSAALLRVMIGSVMAAPIWLATRPRWPGREVMRWHLLRGGLSSFMGLTFFFALTRMPIAEAIAISFIAPLIALYLAAVLLGEAIRPTAIVGSLLGFVGTLAIVGGQFGNSAMDGDYAVGLAAILVSAVLYAINFIIIRKQSQAARPAEIATFHSGVQVVVLGLAAPWFFVMPGLPVFTDTAMAAGLTVIAAMLLAWAYARAETQELVPLEYSGFLWAALFGWLFFAEQVTLPTILGTSLIVTGCLIATRRGRPEQTAL